MCCESSYTPLSDASLWRVLRGIKPSQRQALAGLDDVTAAGMNGFSTLSQVAENMKEKDVVKALEKGKRYLKSTYPAKCARDSFFYTHSTTFALSDDADVDLEEPTFAIADEDCADCVELISSMAKVQKLVEERGDDDLLYDVNIALDDIKAYMKHQIRDAQQKLAKVLAFEHLDEKTGFWLKDYCQKVLPSKFREGQKEYFGKKGMSLHVDILFLKENGVLAKIVYFTSMYRCDQGLVDSLCLEVLC